MSASKLPYLSQGTVRQVLEVHMQAPPFLHAFVNSRILSSHPVSLGTLRSLTTKRRSFNNDYSSPPDPQVVPQAVANEAPAHRSSPK